LRIPPRLRSAFIPKPSPKLDPDAEAILRGMLAIPPQPQAAPSSYYGKGAARALNSSPRGVHLLLLASPVGLRATTSGGG
jgi:hypothetical protein